LLITFILLTLRPYVRALSGKFLYWATTLKRESRLLENGNHQVWPKVHLTLWLQNSPEILWTMEFMGSSTSVALTKIKYRYKWKSKKSKYCEQ
jgi:hypothetical protein